MNELKIENISEAELKINAKNINIHNSKSIEKIKKSIETFGFRNPLLVDSNNIVIAGNGRLEAGRLLGIKEFPCIRLDDLNDVQIKAFGVADNRVAMESFFDEEKLVELVGELEDINFDISSLCFDSIEIEELMLKDEDDNDSSSSGSIVASKEAEEKVCPHCGEPL